MAILRLCVLALMSAVMLSPTAVMAQVTPERGIFAVDPGDSVREERRSALVMGNSAYEDSPLANPVNDARAMAGVLKRLGFEVVEKENLTMPQMIEAIQQFGRKLRQGGVGLFYFAGHGLQVNGENYLIPIKSGIEFEEQVRYKAVNVGEALAEMEFARNRLNIVILDACRNNPFRRGFRSASRGLANITAPSGTLIAYATAPGSVAQDGDGKNGLYTQELIENVQIDGLKVEEVFKRVRRALQTKTNNQQIPWESSSLVGDFYFKLPEQERVAAAKPAPAISPPEIKQAPVLQPTPPPPPPPEAETGKPSAAVKEKALEHASVPAVTAPKTLPTPLPTKPEQTVAPSGSQRKLGIFPMLTTNAGYGERVQLAGAVVEAVGKHKSFTLVLNDCTGDVNTAWTRKNTSSALEPNLDFVVKKARDSGIDVALMYWFQMAKQPYNHFVADIQIHLIDIRTGKAYTSKTSASDRAAAGILSRVESLTGEQIEAYDKDVRYASTLPPAGKESEPGLASIPPPSKMDAQPLQRSKPPYKLAIFPWKLKNSASNYVNLLLDRIVKSAIDSNVFTPVLSYYKIANPIDIKQIDKNIIGDSDLDQLWTGTQTRTPNIDYVCKIASALNVDVVVQVEWSVVDKSAYITSDLLRIYIIDVASRRLISVEDSSRLYIASGQFDAEMPRILDNLIDKFKIQIMQK